MKKIWNHVISRTILLMLLCIFPLNLFTLYSAFQMKASVKEKIESSMRNEAQVYIQSLDSQMENADNLVFDLMWNNGDVFTFASETDEVKYINAKQCVYLRLEELLNMKSAADAYFIYLPKNSDSVIAASGAAASHSKDIMTYVKEKTKGFVDNEWMLGEVSNELWAFRLIRQKDAYYGATINLTQLNRMIEKKISIQGGTSWFSEKKSESVDGGIVVSADSKKGTAVLHICTMKNEVLADFSFARQGIMIIAVLFLAMIPLMFFMIHKMLIGPIQKLNKAHTKIQENENYRIEEHADTAELDSTFASFNNMADNIQRLTRENIEKERQKGKMELEKNQMELENLQLQIRPHFLLNTFNLIYMLAEQGEYKSVKELVLYLSDYFRYIYRDGKKLELFDKELHLIEGYMKAVDIRYPGMISIIYQIEPEIYWIRIPPLLIHNFIENSVKHAMILGQKLHIVVSGSYEKDEVILQISDDGRGMDEEDAKAINEGIFYKEDERVHVGIFNSIRRLKFFYGEKANLSVESTLGEGTVFTIVIPYEVGEE